jgi:hypothetical protein
MDIELLKNVIALLLTLGALGLALGALEQILFAAPAYIAGLLDRLERAQQLRELARRFPNLSSDHRLRQQRPRPRGKG